MIWYVIINSIICIPIELAKLLFLTIIQLPIYLITKDEQKRRYIWNQFLAIDQNVNVLCGGAVDETISSRVYKARNTNKVAKFVVVFLDLFQKDHAKLSEETNIIDDSIL